MSATPPPSKRRKLESVLPSSTKKQKPTNKKSTSSAGEKRCKHANTKKKPEFVWGKVKSYPWWPAVIIRPSDYKTVSKSVIKKKPENATLVQFFGSYDYCWLPKKKINKFVELFPKHSKQASDDLQTAIEEALDEYEECYGEFDIYENVACKICSSKGNEDKMLLCDNCESGFSKKLMDFYNSRYHTYCLSPQPTQEEIAAQKWYCTFCVKAAVSQFTTSEVIRPGIVGLPNLGQSCYINSLLQCLNRIKTFTSIGQQAEQRYSLLETLVHVIQGMQSGASDMRARIIALKIEAGKYLDFKYLGIEQQDVNEFTVHLLDYIHEHAPKVRPTQIVNTETCAEIWKTHISSGLTHVSQNFDGVLMRTRVCKMGHKLVSYEIFRVLTLQLTKAKGDTPISLQQLMENFWQPETLFCRCCDCGGAHDVEFNQYTEVVQAPKILVIQLARFTGLVGEEDCWWTRKINTEVSFPTQGFQVCRNSSQLGSGYALFANHKGGTGGGHYWAVTRNSDGASDQDEWFSFNDNAVKKLSDTALPQQLSNAYILFYSVQK